MSYTAVLSSKGQITLPSEIRKILGLSAGRRLHMDVNKNSITVKPATSHEELARKWTAEIKAKGIKPLRDASAFYQTRKPRI
jgi:AbrB family looped-hinge helix DNA binding protein